MKQCRSEADNAYRQLVSTVNALCLIEGEEKYTTFIDHVNVMIDERKTILRTRSTINQRKTKRTCLPNKSPRQYAPADKSRRGISPSPPKSFIFRQTSCLIKRNHYICCQNHVRYIYRLELTAMRNIILFIFIILTVHLNMSARGSGEKPSIVVLHSINFEESWTKQTYLDIENKFGKEGFTVKAIPLQIPGIRTMEGFQEKRQMILERVPVPPTLVVCIGDPSWLITRPLFDKEWKDVPSIICYARDNMYPKEEYLIDLDTNALETLTPITDVVKGYNATFIKYSVYIKQTIELIKKLQPGLTKLAFIFDHRYISQQTKADVEAVLRKDFPGIQFEPLSTTSISTENLLDRLASFDNKTGVLYYSWYRTQKDNENRYLVDNVQKMINSFSVPPVFTLQDVQTENGNFAGGYYVSPEDYAQVTANTIEMILSGKDSKEISTLTSGTPKTYLNYQHLLLHQIDPGLYPPNATYFQEPPGFFQKYKVHIISLLVILVLLITIGILRVHLFIQKQKGKDKELRIARQAQDLNQKYQLVLKASNMMTWTWDVRAEIIECNNVYLTQRSARDKGVNGIFKMSPDEFYSGVYPDDLDRLRDKMEALASARANR